MSTKRNTIRKRRDEVKAGDTIRSSHGYDLLITEVQDTAAVRTDERHVGFIGHLHGDPAAPTRSERYPAGSTVEVYVVEPAPNPVTRSMVVSAFPTWLVREYANGMWDAVPVDRSSSAISPGFSNWLELRAWLVGEVG